MVRFTLVSGLLALSACAADTAGGGQAAASAGADCFTLDAVTAYHRADFDTVYVSAAAATYRLELAGACGEMGWTDAVQRSRGNSGMVCPGANAGAGDPYNAVRCLVTRADVVTPPAQQMTPMPQG